MNQVYKNLALFMVIGLIVILLFTVFSTSQQGGQETPNFSEFLRAVESGRVESVTIRGNLVTYTLKDGGQPQRTFIVDYPDLIKMLRERGRPDRREAAGLSNPWYTIVLQWFPMLLFIGVWIFFMRQMQGGGAKALSFGKARARLISEKQNKVTFQDVAGVDEAKEELREIIDFLKDPQKFQKLGGKIPKGVLLVGPPGTGKTLLAKAIAGEANVPFFSISGSDFVEMFVGVGASRVRDLFEQGKKHAPCIIFMDEIDAVGRHRGAGLGGGHDEREQTLNQLLVEMDGFETNEGVILIAATNRPDVLDPALLRPGRFDRQVVVPRPDVKGREEILSVHARRIPLAPNVELKVLARGTPGFSGADLANLVNEAALLAARQNKKLVEMLDFENAKDKVLMGVERRSMIISDTEKRTIAYHEAGHALVADFLPGADPLHKVTIIPRGRALGLTMQLPMDDKYNYSRDYLVNRITILLGGRTAEEIVLQQQTTGAGDDLEKATEMARKMVCEWGMSDRLGPLTFGKNEEHIFLGREVARAKDYSEETALVIDSEIKRIVVECAGARQADPRGEHREAPRAGPGPPGARVARLRGDRAHPPRPAVHRGPRAGLAPPLAGAVWSVTPGAPIWQVCGGRRPRRSPSMGVVNVSPESFHRRVRLPAATRRSLRAALAMVEAGAALIDVGARSTAPYLRHAIDEAEETARLARAVELLAAKLPVPISADTARPGPARAALDAGARVINDVSALRDPRARAPGRPSHGAGPGRSWPRPARRDCRASRRRPARRAPVGGLTGRIAGGRGPIAARGGTATRARGRHSRRADRRRSRHRLLSRRGGWRGTSGMLRVLAGLAALRALGRPLCRRRVAQVVHRRDRSDRADTAERLAGSLAATAIAVVHGAALVRTHDVAETRDAVRGGGAAAAARGRERA